MGDRRRGNTVYRRVYGLVDRKRLLEERWPTYLQFDPVFHRELQQVPVDRVIRHYVPSACLRELNIQRTLDAVQACAVELVDELKAATSLPDRSFGISGSVLVGLHSDSSDIDPVVYGREASIRVREALETLLNGHGCFLRYDAKSIEILYESRSMSGSMSLRDFARHERRKVFEGKYRGRDYFVRCVKEWDETSEKYGDRQFYPEGRSSIAAVICDASESILTPCRYEIRNVKVTDGPREKVPSSIVSFRGRFCEQAFEGERISARGELERVVDRSGESYCLVIGSNPLDSLMAIGD